MSLAPTATVIVPTYAGDGVIGDVVRAHAEQATGGAAVEIIVVDDASPGDPCSAFADLVRRGSVQLLRNDRNLGAGATRNRGLARARGEIIVLSDGDCVPAPGFLLSHLAAHRAHPDERVAVQGVIRHPAGVTVTPLMRLGNVVEVWRCAGPVPVDDFTLFASTNISLKRSFFQPRFDETLFSSSGWEDTELGLRMTRNGMRIVTAPDAVSEHRHFLTPAQYIRKVRRYGGLFRRWSDALPPPDRAMLERRFNFLFDREASLAANLLVLRKRLFYNPLTGPAWLALAQCAERSFPETSATIYRRLYPYLFLTGYRGEAALARAPGAASPRD